MLILDPEQVKQAISMEEAIDLVEQAYVAFSANQAAVPPRSSVQVGDARDFTLFMPGYLPAVQGLGLKIVSVFPENVHRGIPAITAAILMCDAQTGVPAALLDGTFLTALRTGAASGVATKYLARPQASSLAVIGTGGMAAAQLEAVCCVRAVQNVYLHNRTREKAEEFGRWIGQQDKFSDLRCHICSSAEEAVCQADVVVACTGSSTPVVRFDWLKPGSHVNGIGSFRSDMQEVDEALVTHAECIAVDAVSEASLAGDLCIPLGKKAIHPSDLVEIGTLIALGGKGRTGRMTETGITYFKSVGLAVQDLAVAARVIENAGRLGLGTWIPWSGK